MEHLAFSQPTPSPSQCTPLAKLAGHQKKKKRGGGLPPSMKVSTLPTLTVTWSVRNRAGYQAYGSTDWQLQEVSEVKRKGKWGKVTSSHAPVSASSMQLHRGLQPISLPGPLPHSMTPFPPSLPPSSYYSS